MTGQSLADAFVSARMDWTQFDSELNGGLGQRTQTAGNRAGTSFSSSFGKAAKRLAVTVGGILASREILQGMNTLVGKASDLSETINKADVIFGKNAITMRRWARNADTSFGLSTSAALASAASFGDMFSQIGFTEKAAARMSRSTIKMAADLGSFNNLETSDVLDRISASLRGEFDSLQLVIPNINAARVESKALAMTGKTVAKELTAQEKAAATLAIIHKDGARAAGDFGRTQDGLANSNKVVSAQWENLQTKLGKRLLPVYQAISGVVRTQVMPQLLQLADNHLPKISKAATRLVKDADLGSFFEKVGTAISGADFSAAGEGASKIGEGFSKVDWGAVKDALGDSFADTMNVAGVVMGFLADNADRLAGFLPELAVAFAAYKTAQAAANIAALASLPITALQVASNFALAKSNRALTAATAQATVAENAATVSKGRGVIATIASRVASVAAAAASKAWAGAQWLLNAALSANPIGLVIAGAAGLAAGFVVLYKKSDTFRSLVNGLWNNVLKPFGEFLGGVLVAAVRAVASNFLRLGEYGATAFKLLVKVAFMAFDGILKAAEKGLGWIPGLGDKIKAARRRFDEFGDRTVAQLERVADKSRQLREALDNATRPRVALITIKTQGGGTRVVGGGGHSAPDLEGRRSFGGKVKAGRVYKVGEGGPERFVPAFDGHIEPSRGRGSAPAAFNIYGDIITTDPRAAARALIDEQRKALALAGSA